MTLPDPIDVALQGDWPSFIQPLVDRVVVARDHNEPMHMTRAELDELNRRTDTRSPTNPHDVAPFDGDGPFTFLGWPTVIDANP